MTPSNFRIFLGQLLDQGYLSFKNLDDILHEVEHQEGDIGHFMIESEMPNTKEALDQFCGRFLPLVEENDESFLISNLNSGAPVELSAVLDYKKLYRGMGSEDMSGNLYLNREGAQDDGEGNPSWYVKENIYKTVTFLGKTYLLGDEVLKENAEAQKRKLRASGLAKLTAGEKAALGLKDK